MLQYLIILLDDTSTSYCHYENSRKEKNLIPLDVLKAGIRFGMMENLMIQFIYPDYELPKEYKEAIESIDHSKIVSSVCEDEEMTNEADVVVYHDWAGMSYEKLLEDKCVVLRTSKADLFERYMFLKDVLSKVVRLNIVITDVEKFTDEDYDKYKEVLHALSEQIENLYVDGKSPQLNLLTDRMMLKEMNSCGAGYTNITLAPNGKFYVCPAFYYDDEADSIGDLEGGLDIKNKQLYRLDHAPICSHCDAYQCKRCIWLNRKTTFEVNTPSHEQCVLAHLERNASRQLLQDVRKHGTFLPEQEDIKEINYLDPFDKKDEWL
ncbi:MAG: CXXX repeat peptide maturase [Bacteroidaceae bacterium]|nr:CXXX repeat peptide maturase [Bacteroidaceae bacterium]